MFCILPGVGVVIGTLLIVKDAQEIEEQVIVAVLGSVGAILTNYIASIYLKMRARATQSLAGFHARLVDTHKLFLGNLLASRIEKEQQRYDTLQKLALHLSVATPVSEDSREG